MSQDLDIQLLLKDPKTALLPVLQTIKGWEQVASSVELKACCAAVSFTLCSQSLLYSAGRCRACYGIPDIWRNDQLGIPLRL